MKRPTIRLGYVIELVAASAVGFGFARSHLPLVRSLTPGWGWIRLLGGAGLAGLAVVGGIGVAIEATRGRRPSTWGLGRWIWSIAGVSVLFSVMVQLVAQLAKRLAYAEWLPTNGAIGLAAMFTFFGGFAWAIAAVCVTAMLAGTPSDPKPDAREWSGRIFASFVVALNIAHDVLRAIGR